MNHEIGYYVLNTVWHNYFLRDQGEGMLNYIISSSLKHLPTGDTEFCPKLSTLSKQTVPIKSALAYSVLHVSF